MCLLAVHAKADLLWGLSDYKIRRTTYNPRLVAPWGGCRARRAHHRHSLLVYRAVTILSLSSSLLAGGDVLNPFYLLSPAPGESLIDNPALPPLLEGESLQRTASPPTLQRQENCLWGTLKLCCRPLRLTATQPEKSRMGVNFAAWERRSHKKLSCLTLPGRGSFIAQKEHHAFACGH